MSTKTNQKPGRGIARKTTGVVVATMLFGLFVGVPAMAGGEGTDDSCQSAVASGKQWLKDNKFDEDAKVLGSGFGEMRNACADFRSCKRSCRQAKRDAKSQCRGLKGKKKRQCKKNARKEKRSCKRGCRDEMKQSGCRGARGTFWKKVGSSVSKAFNKRGEGKSKYKAIKKSCGSFYKKGG